MKVAVYRKEHFNAAHRLYNKDWTDKQNDETFGKCNNPNYHGHNYELVVKLEGIPNPETGYVYDLKKLSTIIKDNIISKFDHKNLNLDTEYFKEKNPTAENIVVVIWELLREKIELEFDLKVTLYETERNYVEYPA